MNEELARAQHRQLARLRDLETGGDAVGGWKLGLTSGESRDAFGPGVRPFGFILDSRILASGDSLDWSDVGNGGIENELCFVIAEDVTGRVDRETIVPFISGMAPAFEINQRRIDKDSPPAARIADDLANWGIVVGDTVPIPEDWDPDSLVVTLRCGEEKVETVRARGHIDDHFETLARLANELRRFGRRLKAGDLVITGAFGKQAQPAPGTWSGDFGPDIGRVELIIEPA